MNPEIGNKELPLGWQWAQIGEILQPSADRIDPSKANGIAYIGLEHIGKNTGKIIGQGNSDDVKSLKSKFFHGDLLYGKLRPYLNKVWVAEFEGLCSTDILVFHKNKYISNKYLLFRFLQPDFVRFANLNVSGVQHPRVDLKKLADFEIPIAPLPEQHRIVARIEELFSRLDAGVEELKKAKVQLQRYRQSVLKAAVTGRLTAEWRAAHPEAEPAEELIKKSGNSQKGKLNPESWESKLFRLPEEWIWTAVECLSTSESNAICAGPFGTIFKAKDFRQSGIPIIFLRHVGSGKYLTHKPTYMDENKWHELFKPYSVYGGELLITKLGDPPGVCAIYPYGIGPAMVTPDVIKMNVNEETAISRFLMYYFNSESARRFAFGYAFGTTRLRMTLPIFREMPVPLPPLREQEEILSQIERIMSIADSQEVAIQKSIHYSKSLHQSILKHAFQGKLVPQNPSDEPASVLLERIKAERINQTPTRGRKGNSNARQMRLVQ